MIADLALTLLLAPAPVRLAIAAPGIALVAWVAWQAIKRGWWGAMS